MKRCEIDGSPFLADDDRIVCLAAGHILKDRVSLIEKMMSNATPDDTAGLVRPESPRQYPAVDFSFPVPYTSPIRDELSDDALHHRHSQKLIGSADQ